MLGAPRRRPPSSAARARVLYGERPFAGPVYSSHLRLQEKTSVASHNLSRSEDIETPTVRIRDSLTTATVDGASSSIHDNSFICLCWPKPIESFDEPERLALSMAYSNHLTTNCMLTSYAAGWRRLTPLFSVRAFRHVPRPVELNPWMDGSGRG